MAYSRQPAAVAAAQCGRSVLLRRMTSVRHRGWVLPRAAAVREGPGRIGSLGL